jgi:hypothetical protein
MGRKREKAPRSPERGDRRNKVRLCAFGFKLEPKCGAFHLKFNLLENPFLGDLIEQDEIPPYCYEYMDANTVRMDQCLICHMKKGITPQEYEEKNEAAGITRSNFARMKPSLEAVMDSVAQKIRDTRQELIKEQGLSFEMPEMANVRDC